MIEAEHLHAATLERFQQLGLTAELVRRLLDYDPDTGVITWRNCCLNQQKPGEVAGWVNAQGYQCVSLRKETFRSHRLAWLYMTGEWPLCDIDHIDNDRLNNRWENLRIATRSQNSQNQRLRKNNKSGFKGVYWHKAGNKWAAGITHEGRYKHLGLFPTADMAHAAYSAASQKYFGEFARLK